MKSLKMMENKMQTVNKQEFLAWTEGIYLNFSKGKGIAPDEIACEKAMEALEKGETIAFLENDNIISYMKMVGEEYVEFVDNV